MTVMNASVAIALGGILIGTVELPAPPPGTVWFENGDYVFPGYVAGDCGHRVAGSEWAAGLRTCERC